MNSKTIVLRKDDHWYVINSLAGNEREILLTVLEYAERRSYNIRKDEVLALASQLGYEIDIQENLELAS